MQPAARRSLRDWLAPRVRLEGLLEQRLVHPLVEAPDVERRHGVLVVGGLFPPGLHVHAQPGGRVLLQVDVAEEALGLRVSPAARRRDPPAGLDVVVQPAKQRARRQLLAVLSPSITPPAAFSAASVTPQPFFSRSAAQWHMARTFWLC